MRSKIRNLIIWLVIVLIVGVGCILIGYKIGHNNQDKCKEEPTETKEEKKEPEEKTAIDKRDAEELVHPFLNAVQLCDAEGTYYFKKVTKYEDLSGSKAIEIALMNYSYEEWQKIYEYDKQETEFDPENPVDDEFPDIETSYIKEKIEYTFGKNKTINFPKKLDFWDETYKLKGDKYVIEAQGGGCTIFTDYLKTQVIEGMEVGDEYIVQVNFVYVTYDVKEDDDLEDPNDAPVILYNNISKKRVVAKGFKYGDEDKHLDTILNSDKTDYMLFTFKLEDNHYIFDNVEIIER